jgi:hypothetical protein
MKSAALLKAVYKDCLERGYVLVGNNLYPPHHPAAIAATEIRNKRKPRVTNTKIGWIDDTRNIKNKACQKDAFMMLIGKELGVEVWPEFYFSTERQYRFDYAIPTMANSPQLKIAIEQEGGIWAKGNSGHSSGTGIQRDMDKNNLAISQGWAIIRRTPDQMLTSETIELIRSVINRKV